MKKRKEREGVRKIKRLVEAVTGEDLRSEYGIEVVQKLIQIVLNGDAEGEPECVCPDTVYLDQGEIKLQTENDAGSNYDFMTPEQYQELKDFDVEKANIYSVGLFFYYCCNGLRLPFQEKDSFEGTRKALKRRFAMEPVPQLGSQGLDAIFSKCLAWDPGQRYPSLECMLQDIGQLKPGDLSCPSEGAVAIPEEEDFLPEDPPEEEIAEQGARPKLFETRKQKIIAAAIPGFVLLLGCMVFVIGRVAGSHSAESEPKADIRIIGTEKGSGNSFVYDGRKQKIVADLPLELPKQQPKKPKVKASKNKKETKIAKINDPSIADPKVIPEAEPAQEEPKKEDPKPKISKKEKTKTSHPAEPKAGEEKMYITGSQKNEIIQIVRSYVEVVNGQLSYSGSTSGRKSTTASYQTDRLDNIEEIANYLCTGLSLNLIGDTSYQKYGVTISTNQSSGKIKLVCKVILR